MPSPGAYNLVVPQTTTFNFSSVIQTNGTPWNLTGYTAIMTVRPFLGSTTVTLLATTGNGKITLGGSTGSITVNLSALDTTLKAESYVYDLVLDSGSEITRILEGQFIVTAGVTTV